MPWLNEKGPLVRAIESKSKPCRRVYLNNIRTEWDLRAYWQFMMVLAKRKRKRDREI